MAKRAASEAGEASDSESERSELPSGWCWATFDDVADVAADLVDPRAEPQSVHIAPNHIESKTGRWIDQSTVERDRVESPKHRFRPGQILYSKIRPNLAKAMLAEVSGLCSADMYPIDARIDAQFLLRWMLSDDFTFQATRQHGRTVLPKINRDALGRLIVPVPPLAEQRRIVAKLEAMLGRIRRARAALDSVPTMVDRYKKSVLAAACAFSSSEELGVRRVALRDVIDGFESGRNLSAHARPARADEYGVLKVSAVSWGEFDATENKALFDGDRPKRSEFVRKGDVLISRANTSELVGAVVWVQSEYPNLMLPDKILRLRIQATEAEPRYVVYALRTPAVRRYFADVATGTSDSMRNISQAKLGETAFPLPPLDEQRAIVARIDAAFARARALLSAAETARAQLDTLERSLLAKAFRGELVPQDPSDEPASALLERVRAERSTTPAKKPRKPKGAPVAGVEPVARPIATPPTTPTAELDHEPTQPAAEWVRQLSLAGRDGMPVHDVRTLHAWADADAFYRDLRQLVATGLVREERRDDVSWVIANENRSTAR